MVAFSYTQSFGSKLNEAVKNILGSQNFDGNQTYDQLEQARINAESAQRQIDMQAASLSQADPELELLKIKADTSLREIRRISQEISDESQNTKTQAAVQLVANSTDTENEPVRLTDAERRRLEEEGAVQREEGLVALSVSGSNEPNNDDEGDSDDGENRQTVRETPSASGVKPNPLNQYATYTYGISLHYMDLQQYNDVVLFGAAYSTADGRVIIASGGRQNQEMVRDELFKNTDLYIENLKLVTVIGHNARSRGTNAVTIEFTVKEPMGMSFLEKLVSIAKRIGIRGWDQMPLVLQIDFFGVNPDGSYAEGPIQGLTKYICIKVTEIAIGITTMGGEYKVTAIPTGHVSLLQSASSVPANFELTAKSVGDFFGDSDLSFASALNQYQKKMVDKGYQTVADEFVFIVDPEIAKNDIFIPELHNLLMAPAQNDKNRSPRLDRNRGIIPVNAGTNIKEVVNLVVRSSDYYRNKIKVPDEIFSEGQEFTSTQLQTIIEGKPIDLHKLTVQVEYVPEWDTVRKQYKRRYIYNIRKYKYHNNKFPEARKSLPSPQEIKKVYNYMFMADNQEIRDFKIQFNTLFFQALTAFETKGSSDNIQNKEKAPKTKLQGNAEGILAPLRYLHVINQTQSSSQLSDGSKENVEAVDLFNSILSNARGDMIDLDMQIAGDPDLIKQDELFFPPSDQEFVNGSINMDTAEVFCLITFRIPKDLNQDTGLMEFEPGNSAFSGIYKMVEVESVFEQGQFYQNVRGYRLYDQRVDIENKGRSRASQDANPRSGWESSRDVKRSTDAEIEDQTLAETQRLQRQNAERADQTSSSTLQGAKVGRAGQAVSNGGGLLSDLPAPNQVLQNLFGGRTGRAGQGRVLKDLPTAEIGETNYPSP